MQAAPLSLSFGPRNSLAWEHGANSIPRRVMTSQGPPPHTMLHICIVAQGVAALQAGKQQQQTNILRGNKEGR